MHAFEAAHEQQLDSIEFDVWVTKDDELVIIHGGKNGELPELADPNDDFKPAADCIFDMTLAELQEYHQHTKAYLNAPSTRDAKSLLPTLDQLFDYANQSSHKMLFLIEIKSPKILEIRQKYDRVRCL